MYEVNPNAAVQYLNQRFPKGWYLDLQRFASTNAAAGIFNVNINLDGVAASWVQNIVASITAATTITWQNQVMFRFAAAGSFVIPVNLVIPYRQLQLAIGAGTGDFTVSFYPVYDNFKHPRQ